MREQQGCGAPQNLKAVISVSGVPPRSVTDSPSLGSVLVYNSLSAMPPQARLRLIKRCRLYVPRGEGKILPITRGVYVLYCEKPEQGKKVYKVFYIGVGGVSKNAKSGIGGRIKDHAKRKGKWTHYSFFEVHDNVSDDEIHELEGLFLHIFQHDPGVRLDNKQLGSTILRSLSKDSSPVWRDNS